jgi:hypothetical protein
MVGIDDDRFGVASARKQRAHGVARFPSSYGASAAFDHAGDLETGNVGWHSGWRWIPAFPLEEIGAVEARGSHANQDFGVSGLGRLTVDEREHLGSSGTGNRYCFHGANLRASPIDATLESPRRKWQDLEKGGSRFFLCCRC